MFAVLLVVSMAGGMPVNNGYANGKAFGKQVSTWAKSAPGAVATQTPFWQ